MACLGFALAHAAGVGAFPTAPAPPSCCTRPAAAWSAGASPFLCSRRRVGPAPLPPVPRAAPAARRRSPAPGAVVLSAGGPSPDGPPSPLATPAAAAAARDGAVVPVVVRGSGGGSGRDGGGGRPWRQWAAATAAAVALLVSPGAARAARRSVKAKEAAPPAAAEAVRYDGKKQLDDRERAVSLVITGGAFAGLFGWAYMSNRRDDREESVRVREEVDRLEKVKQEFVEVDGDDNAPDDADMMAELRKRLAADSAAGAAGSDPAAPTDDPDAPPPPPPAVGGVGKS